MAFIVLRLIMTSWPLIIIECDIMQYSWLRADRLFVTPNIIAYLHD